MRLQARFFCRRSGEIIEKAGPLNYDQRVQILDRDGWRCRRCGRELVLYRKQANQLSDHRPAAIDHIFPRARGGQNDPSNLQALCESCNSAKGARTQ